MNSLGLKYYIQTWAKSHRKATLRAWGLQKYNWCETMKKELTVFRILPCMKRCPINIIDLSLYGEVYCFETLQEKHIPLCSLYKDTLFWFWGQTVSQCHPHHSLKMCWDLQELWWPKTQQHDDWSYFFLFLQWNHTKQ